MRIIRQVTHIAFIPFALVFALGIPSAHAQAAPQALGEFEGHGDVGTVVHAGKASFEAGSGSYTLSGSGGNMWFGQDEFQFAWKKMTGDVAISADIELKNDGGNAHRKAVLMIRQSLDSNAAAVDVARHGDGLTSMQFRLRPGEDDHEVQSNVSAPARVRLEKRGDFFYAFASNAAGTLEPSGASIKLALKGEFYIGIGVCSHDKDAITTAVFRNVKVEQLSASAKKPVLWSTLEAVPIASTDRRVAYTAQAHFEAPNWSRDGSFFLFNQDGGIYRLPVGTKTPTLVSTDPQTQCNNDHGISPDGTMLAISDSTADKASAVYTVPITGGTPKRITSATPSYWHGWSPDGKTLAFTGQRNGDFDIYTISVQGGEEKRLTTAPGLDDGPEYSPDGQWIYFNSVRSGQMQIWRMHPDGSGQEHFIESDANDWFAHISPDGRWMVFVRYDKSVSGHPADKDVQLILVSMADKSAKVLATLYGGQGTMNVPSWSPDSKAVAFVSYQYLVDEPRD